ncbi:MAG: tyrosine-protein phosphatase [Myxococcota bacterium]
MTQHRRIRFPGLLALGVATALAGALLWNITLRDQLVPKRLVAVEPGALYRSGQISAELVHGVLAQHDIQLVVDLNEIEERWREEQRAEEAAAAALGIRHIRLPLRGDGTGDLDRFAQALAEIHAAQERDQPTLVHCAAGARRTGAVIALYQVLVQGIPTSEAITELGRYGNTLEDSALLAFVNEQMGPLAERLRDRGIIQRIPEPLPRFAIP